MIIKRNAKTDLLEILGNASEKENIRCNKEIHLII